MATLAAISDVHSPTYLREFLSSLGLRVRDSCLFLLAGDMILRSRVSQFKPVLRGIRKAFSGQIVSAFGNEEHDAVKASLLERHPEICWLDDSEVVLQVERRRLRIVGTRGSLAVPTSWQKAHVPDIEETYTKRVAEIGELLKRRPEDDLVVFLSHYAPMRVTIQGEAERLYPVLTDGRMEDVVRRTSPDIVIHGHAHNATTLSARVDGVRVFNVAFPAKRSTTVIDLW